MYKVFKQLWFDDTGAILSIEILLIATIVILGILAGLASLRDAVITELSDLGGSISHLDQSYVLHGAISHSSATAGTVFNDVRDFGDVAGDPVLVNERCLVICNAATVVPLIGNEGDLIVAP